MCVDVCPAKSKTDTSHKAINMEPVAEHRDVERPRWDFFQSIPPLDRSLIPHDSVKGSQVLEPLFEFSGACGGCGETPYIRLVSQLFGDRMIVANATGCSSIYGANLPTTPWTVNAAGRGPAWNNSLFEDNAEFGLGMRLALDAQTDQARRLLERLAPALDEDLTRGLLDGAQDTEAEIVLQRERVDRLREALTAVEGPLESDARHLLALAGDLVRQGVWIIGGDGWAYDIGFGGVDQVLSSGRNVNILVLDTEVYSNTGGQASKATPRGAVAKFAAAGKGTAKKDLGAIARSYGNVYVAQVSMGANDLQTTKALLEADAWPGPSLVIAYSTCIAHGIDMSKSMTHQKDAVKSGYWPLYRFHPSEVEGGKPFKLDSSAPSIPIADFVATETRFAVLQRTHPERAAELAALAQADADERWRYYEQLAGIERTVPHLHQPDPDIVPEVESDAGYRYESEEDRSMTVDLRTRYLGLELRSPIVASASPLNGEPATARLVERSGAGAIVLPSLFEEEILAEELELNRSLEQGTEDFAEALDYFPAVEAFVGAADRYLDRLERIKDQSSVPVIASLNATTVGGWVSYARRIQEAGADALELNLYHIAADPRRTASDMEAADLALIAAVRAAVTIPLAIKLSPYYSALAHFAAEAVSSGADGLVLFNRFYQPDLDLDTLDVVPRLDLSQPWEMRLPVRWIAILRPQLGPAVSLAGELRRRVRDRRGQGPDGRRGCRDDDLGPAAPWPAAHRRRRGPAPGLDDRARIRVGRPAAGQRQPGHGRGPVGVRARELHEDPAVLGHAARADLFLPDEPGRLTGERSCAEKTGLAGFSSMRAPWRAHYLAHGASLARCVAACTQRWREARHGDRESEPHSEARRGRHEDGARAARHRGRAAGGHRGPGSSRP